MGLYRITDVNDIVGELHIVDALFMQKTTAVSNIDVTIYTAEFGNIVFHHLLEELCIPPCTFIRLGNCVFHRLLELGIVYSTIYIY